MITTLWKVTSWEPTLLVGHIGHVTDLPAAPNEDQQKTRRRDAGGWMVQTDRLLVCRVASLAVGELRQRLGGLRVALLGLLGGFDQGFGLLLPGRLIAARRLVLAQRGVMLD